MEQSMKKMFGMVACLGLVPAVWAGLLDGISPERISACNGTVAVIRDGGKAELQFSGVSPERTGGTNCYVGFSVKLPQPVDMRGKALRFQFRAVKPGSYGGVGVKLYAAGIRKPVWDLLLWDRKLFSGAPQELAAVGGWHYMLYWIGGEPEKATAVNRVEFYIGTPRPLEPGEFSVSGLEVVPEKELPEFIPEVYAVEVEKGEFSPHRLNVIHDRSFSGGSAVRLNAPVRDLPEPEAEVSVAFRLPKLKGAYQAELTVRGTAEVAAILKKSAYNRTVDFRLATDVRQGRRFSALMPSNRMDRNCVARTPGIPLDGASRLLLYLPPGVIADRLVLRLVKPPEVPEAAKRYVPPVAPGMRPRVFLNRELLPAVRSGLEAPENRRAWNMVKKRAAEELPLPDRIVPDRQINLRLQAKAFVWLMSGEKKYAREAAAGLNRYFTALEFGSQPDVSREIGNALLSCSMVYDWCYDFFTPPERKALLAKAVELHGEMEIGHPPFRQNVINGHGNEGQFVVDTLAFSIAFYDELPELYRYVTYRIMNEIVPAHTFEFAGGWHNQGTHYGPVRWAGEVQMVMMLERLGWKDIYPDSLKKLARSWLYARLPGALLWEDGDCTKPAKGTKYPGMPSESFFSAMWSRDPLLKGDMLRRGVLERSYWASIAPVTVLCFNDPAIPADGNFDALPQGLITGPAYPVMIQRTGWDISEDSRDMLAFFKGAGYHSGNHQHLDAGHFEIFFREPLVVDLGVYHFYGTPYDFNFNKRAAAHNILTVCDPAEKFAGRVNDGGQQYTEKLPPNVSPRSLQEILAFCRNGRTLAAYSGPDPLKPEAGFLKTDLKPAYHDKIRRYSRSSVFLRSGDPGRPGTVVIYDRVEKRGGELASGFQVNTLAPAEFDGGNTLWVKGEKAQLRCDLLRPAAGNLQLRQKRGREMLEIHGRLFRIGGDGYAQEQGTRNLFSVKSPAREDEYLAVLQPAEKSAEPAVPALRTADTHFEISVGRQLLVLSREYELTGGNLVIQVGSDTEKVVLAGFRPGRWHCAGEEFEIKSGEHAACLKLPAGKHELVKL